MSETAPRYRFGYRSLFWPIALIGVGLVWLLGNLGIITPVSFYTVLQLWPLLLIAVGLDIIFGRRSPVVGSIIALGTLVVAIAILIAAPALGLKSNAEVKSGHFSAPLDNATSAQVDLYLSQGRTTVSSLADSTALIDARLNYVGDVDFTVQGDQQKTIRLQRRGGADIIFWPFNILGDQLRWDIGLTPKIPIDLGINASSGDSTLNLRDLKLKALAVDASSGDLTANLPAMPERYAVGVRASSGSMNFNVPDNAEFNASISMSSGDIAFHVPNNAGVQVNVQNSSSGDVQVPSNYTRTVNNGRTRGTWESPGFGTAQHQIVLTITNMSSGTFAVR